MVLLADGLGVGPGDAVFCPSFTFAATAEVVPMTGASPVFVDILGDTYNIDPAKLDAAIAEREGGGQAAAPAPSSPSTCSASRPTIRRSPRSARKYGLKLISDSAQGFGCTIDGKHPLHWADATATSFFPAKPLGCYGDGGAVLTNDARFHDLLVSLRVHGQAVKSDLEGRTFDHDTEVPEHAGRHELAAWIRSRPRCCSRNSAIFADEIQAAEPIVADRYAAGLGDVVRAPRRR
jgi:dTDP-4-amino-4,6-dideoxygalactose transaminase